MKKIAPFFFLFIFSINSILANDKNDSLKKPNQLYFRTIFCQLNIGYNRLITNTTSLSFEVGYQFNVTGNLYFGGGPFWGPYFYLANNLSFSGYSIRISPNFSLGKNFIIGPLVGYQSLFASKVTYDPGHFAGEDKEYDVYSQKINEIIAQLIFYIKLKKPFMQFYFGIGTRFQNLRKEYSIEGYNSSGLHLVPSDRIDDYRVTIFPTFTIGLKFIFLKFK
jgi:hypothetical protein